MSENINNDPLPTNESIKHLCSLNFSIFTQKLQELRGENKPKDRHGLIRKKWLRVIRSEMKTDRYQTLVSYLYAAKSNIHRNQTLTRIFFTRWKEFAAQQRERALWQRLIYKAKIRQYQIRAAKLRDCRVDLATNLFVNQLHPVEIDEPPRIERNISLENNSTDSPKTPSSPKSKRIIHVHTVEQATETVEPEEPPVSKLLKKVNVKNLMMLLFIGVGCALLTFYLYRFLYVKLGYYDRYQQYQLNETLPPYNPSYDVDYVVNYTELFKSEKDQSIDDLISKMTKEIIAMKMRQTEMRDEIDQLQNAYQEDL